MRFCQSFILELNEKCGLEKCQSILFLTKWQQKISSNKCPVKFKTVKFKLSSFDLNGKKWSSGKAFWGRTFHAGKSQLFTLIQDERFFFSNVSLLELKLWLFTHSTVKLFVTVGIWKCVTYTRLDYLHFYYLVLSELYHSMSYKSHPCRLSDFIYLVK